MDRERALEILDAARPDSADLNGGEFADAVDFLKSDSLCRQEFAARQQLDMHIGRSVRDVDVPGNLKEQLLVSLRAAEATLLDNQASAEHNPPSPAASMPSRKVSPSNKKTALRVAAGLAASLMLAASFWFYSSLGSNIYVTSELQQLAVVHLDNWKSLPSFSGNFTPQLPGYGWSNARLHLSHAPLGLPDTSTTNHTIALYNFWVTTPAGVHAEGLLLVAEKRAVTNPPADTHFSSGNVRYIHTNGGEFAAVTWSDDTQVYVCIVHDARTLEQIEKTLRQSSPV